MCIRDRYRISAKSANPSLVLQFPDGGPRKGIFCSLLCWLVSPENDSPAPWSILVNEIKSPVCLYRNCIQFELSDCPAIVTLIDTYTHFEVHVDVSVEFVDDLCPHIFPEVHRAILKGLHKAALSLGYYDSSPSSGLVCSCGKGETHIATANLKLGFWKCTFDRRKCGKLTPLQLLWLDDKSAYPSNTVDKRLTYCHLSVLVSALKNHALDWRVIGTHLGFQPGELANIAGRPMLFNDAPQSWLQAMLSEWLQWAPGDSRGSLSFASFKMLKSALNKSGLAATAYDLSLQ